MIRINQVKLGITHTKEQLHKKVAALLQVSQKDILEINIIRQSIDARKKPEIFYSYVVDVKVKGEEKLLKSIARNKSKASQISKVDEYKYIFPKIGKNELKNPVVIVGMGPAGLFCGYFLALHGFCPILLERGKDVDSRLKSVEQFWQGGALDPNSNVQFGEGGAGTFSDGKLNTLVKDKYGRNRAVLEVFVKFGAKEAILYDAKPHIGTDVLSRIVKSMREEIIRMGGKVCFESQVTDVLVEQGQVKGVVVNNQETIACEQLVLAIGHSARDTFSLLYEKKLPMEQKAFAVGFRVEHAQKHMNQELYGMEDPGTLGAAPYKVTAKTKSGRGVYSFCMCPGGYVVNASSEEGRLAVNGMSYSGRDGSNANSAIIVAVTPKDFGSEHTLAGIEFQRSLEEKAFRLAQGKIPVQRYGDFKAAVLGKKNAPSAADVQEEKSTEVEWQAGSIQPQNKGLFEWADLTGILSRECNEAFVEGMECFGRQIKGFNHPNAIMSAVESRTSSPVRIVRDDESLQSTTLGIYPCGEGAGYAGGITSAAMDGLRVAEVIASNYRPFMN